MSRSGLVPVALLAGLLAATLIGHAQPSAPGSEAKVLAYLSVDKLTPDSRFRVAVVVDLAEPWHVNANPVSAEGLIPTTLEFQPPASIVIDRIIYPPGVRTKVGWNDEPVALYSGRVIVFADAHVNAAAKPGPLKLTGMLRYQACNDSICIAPKNAPVVIETEIVPESQKPQPVHPELFTATTEPAPLAPLVAAGLTDGDNSIATSLKEKGLLPTLVVVFVLGLGLNLTPCVFPMIAITVSYFGGRTEQKLGPAFVRALTYFAGMAITYTILGLVAGLSGSLFGALLQRPLVLIGIGALLVAMALSMFGLYELQPPQFLMQRAAGLSSKAGFVGLFFLGAVVGIIAAPCVAPVQVSLLAFVAKTGDPWLGGLLFFVLSAGLGLPYVILGTFPGLLTRLPKSGTWMVWVKRVFGVALIAVAAWITSPLWLDLLTPAAGGIAFKPYSAAEVAQATSEQRPVTIDFSAEWCGPCRKMERTTFRDKRVMEQAKQFVMLKADLTKEGSPDVEKLRKNFGIWGVPTLVFIGPDGREHTELRKVEYVTATQLLDLLEKAKGIAPTNSPTARAPDVPPQLLNPF